MPDTSADVRVDWVATAMSGPTGYGVNGWWTDEDANLWRARYAQLAPKVVRVIVHQTVLEPVNDNDDPNVINWKRFHFNDPFPIPAPGGRHLTYRRWFEALRDLNVAVMVYTPYLAGWLSANGDRGLMSSFPPKDVAEYGEFVRALLTFLVSEVKYPPERIILEPVNEADLPCGADPAVPCFWDKWQMSDLVSVVRTAHDQAAAVHPAIRIAGLTTCCDANLLPRFVNEYGGAQYLDIVTYHYYEGELDFAPALAQGRKLLTYDKPVYLNESGSTKYWSDGVNGALWHSAVLPQAWAAGINLVQFPMSEWPVMHGGYDKLGLFSDWNTGWAIKPAYWVYVNFHTLFGGAEVLKVTTPVGSIAAAARRRQPDVLSIWLTNMASAKRKSTVFQIDNWPTSAAVVTVYDNLAGPDPHDVFRLQVTDRKLVFSYTLATGSYAFAVRALPQ